MTRTRAQISAIQVGTDGGQWQTHPRHDDADAGQFGVP